MYGTNVFACTFNHANNSPVAGAGSTTGVQETVAVGTTGLLSDTLGNSFCTRSSNLACSQDGTRANDLQYTGALAGADYAIGGTLSGYGSLTLSLRRSSGGDRYDVNIGNSGQISVNKFVSGALVSAWFGSTDLHLATAYDTSANGPTSMTAAMVDVGTTFVVTISGTIPTTIGVYLKKSDGTLIAAFSVQDASGPITAAGRPAIYQAPASSGGSVQIIYLKTLFVDDLTAAGLTVLYGTLGLSDSGPSGNVLALAATGGSGTIGYTLYRNLTNPDLPITDASWVSCATGNLVAGAASVTDNPGAGTAAYYRVLYADSSATPMLASPGRGWVGVQQYAAPLACVFLGDSIDGNGGWVHAWANTNTPNSSTIARTDLARSTATSGPVGSFAVATPTVSVTGGGATGGSLPAGTYSVKVAFHVDGFESSATPAAAFTSASGNIPRVTLPAFPWPYTTAVVFVGTSGSEKLYKLNVTGPTVDLDIAVPAMVAPTLSPTGGAASGGLLAAGTYRMGFAFVDASGNTSPCSPGATVVVAAGNIPSMTVPALAGPWISVNVYVSPKGASGNDKSLYLYSVGATGPTITIPSAQPSPGLSNPLAPRSGSDTSQGTYGPQWQSASPVQPILEVRNLLAILANRKAVQFAVHTPGNAFVNYVSGPVTSGATAIGDEFVRLVTAIDRATALVGAANVRAIVKLGTNSSTSQFAPYGLTASEAANATAVVSWLKTKGIGAIVLHGPPWSSGSGRPYGLPLWNAFLDTLCDGTQVFKGDRFRYGSVLNSPMDLTDGTHPANGGNIDAGQSRAYAHYRAVSDSTAGGGLTHLLGGGLLS